MEDEAKLWQGFTEAEIEAPIEKVWELTSNFGGLAAWFPSNIVESCTIIQGEPQEAGCIRHTLTPVQPDGSRASVKEELVLISEEEHAIKYLVLESPKGGTNGLFATIKLSSLEENGHTLLHWSFQVPPLAQGSSEAELVGFVTGFYDFVLANLAKVVSSQDHVEDSSVAFQVEGQKVEIVMPHTPEIAEKFIVEASEMEDQALVEEVDGQDQIVEETEAKDQDSVETIVEETFAKEAILEEKEAAAVVETIAEEAIVKEETAVEKTIVEDAAAESPAAPNQKNIQI